MRAAAQLEAGGTRLRSLPVFLACVALSAGARAQMVPPVPDARVLGADMTAARAASPRPAECTMDSGGESDAWARARSPRLREFCRTLARGYSDLLRTPSRSASAARRAAELVPGHAAAWVLEARALVRDGRAKEAWPLFQKARSKDRRSLEEPATLHDMALSAAESGEQDEAVATYRALVPRASLLADARQRQRVYVEAAMTVMRRDASALDEALGYLAEARRIRGVPGLSDVVLGATALTLDRQGRGEEARGVAGEVKSAASVLRLARRKDRDLGLPDGELSAIAAMLAERGELEVARAEWRAFLKSDVGQNAPWNAHGKKKLDSLGSTVRRPVRAPR